MSEPARSMPYLHPVEDSCSEEASPSIMQPKRQGDEDFRRLIESTRTRMKAAMAAIEEDQRQLDQVMAEVDQFRGQREMLRANTLKLAELVEGMLGKQGGEKRQG